MQIEEKNEDDPEDLDTTTTTSTLTGVNASSWQGNLQSCDEHEDEDGVGDCKRSRTLDITANNVSRSECQPISVVNGTTNDDDDHGLAFIKTINGAPPCTTPSDVPSAAAASVTGDGPASSGSAAKEEYETANDAADTQSLVGTVATTTLLNEPASTVAARQALYENASGCLSSQADKLYHKHSCKSVTTGSLESLAYNMQIKDFHL